MTSSDDLRHYAIEVKPIGAACNLRCQYCYYLAKGGGHAAGPSLMTDEVLENYIRQVIDIHGRYAEIEFAWHGGEPTMCGIPFFERAMALQQKYGEGRQILNTLQTNGTLLTDEWCQFFRNHQFRIGISIDGPEHLHNIYRKDARGEVYQFLRSFSNYMQFLPVVESLPLNDSHKNVALPPGIYSHQPRNLAPFSVQPEAYGKFLCTIFDEWSRRDVGRKYVQVIEAAIGNLTHRPAGLCVHESVCGHCGVIEKNGDLYRCDRYVFPEYRIGNILQGSLHDMMQTNRKFGEYKLDSLPSACLHCDVAHLCFGGCPKDRLVERITLNGPERRNYLCPGYKMFFRYISQKIKTKK